MSMEGALKESKGLTSIEDDLGTGNVKVPYDQSK